MRGGNRGPPCAGDGYVGDPHNRAANKSGASGIPGRDKCRDRRTAFAKNRDARRRLDWTALADRGKVNAFVGRRPVEGSDAEPQL